MTPARSSPVPRVVKLPCTSTRLQKRYAHLKLLAAVRTVNDSILFEGEILRPGANVTLEKLGANPVILECVGPIGSGRFRDVQWILWRWDQGRQEWREIARAQSRDASWTLIMREAAQAALNPQPELFDVEERIKLLTAELLEGLDRKVEPESEPVRKEVLREVYDQVAGRIAECS